jgi:hypothetical protein
VGKVNPMNLKKSDKMIAIAGVVILIIAAIGIIMYASNEPEDEVPTKTEKQYPFTVNWVIKEEEELSSNSMKIKEPLLKRLSGDGSKEQTVEISSFNLKSIKFFIEYTDTIMKGKILKFLSFIGPDTITMTVFDEYDNKIDSKNIIGSGNATIMYQDNQPITIGIIQAKDEADAWQKLDENLSMDNMMETYKIKVTIDQKETLLFRPLARLAELLIQDTFNLKVTCEYYVYDLVPPEETPEEPPTETNIGQYYSPITWISTNYIGFH